VKIFQNNRKLSSDLLIIFDEPNNGRNINHLFVTDNLLIIDRIFEKETSVASVKLYMAELAILSSLNF
jgi:hypothetical protein